MGKVASFPQASLLYVKYVVLTIICPCLLPQYINLIVSYCSLLKSFKKEFKTTYTKMNMSWGWIF